MSVFLCHLRRLVAPILLVLALAACSTLPSGGREGANAILAERGRIVPAHDPAEAEGLLTTLLNEPLTLDSAVRIGLMRNAGLRAAYARLGFAAADVHDAGRLANPRLSVGVLLGNGAADGDELSLGIAQNFADLLLIGARSRFAHGEWQRVKLDVAQSALDLSADIEAAYHRLVGAQQIRASRDLAARAADLSSQLAERMHAAGNISDLRLALERSAASQARLSAVAAAADETASRLDLGRLMGLPPNQPWEVSTALAPPVPQEEDGAALVRRALAHRPDLESSRRSAQLMADRLGVSRRFRWLGEVDLGLEHERESGGSRRTGPSLSLALPIFDQGQGAVARAEASVDVALAEVERLETEIATAVLAAQARVLAERARALEYREVLIPLRRDIVARTREQVNFMITGAFDLFAARQQELEAEEGYLTALMDYWVARAELARAVGAALPADAALPPSAPADAAPPPDHEAHPQPEHKHH